MNKKFHYTKNNYTEHRTTPNQENHPKIQIVQKSADNCEYCQPVTFFADKIGHYRLDIPSELLPVEPARKKYSRRFSGLLLVGYSAGKIHLCFITFFSYNLLSQLSFYKVITKFTTEHVWSLVVTTLVSVLF